MSTLATIDTLVGLSHGQAHMIVEDKDKVTRDHQGLCPRPPGIITGTMGAWSNDLCGQSALSSGYIKIPHKHQHTHQQGFLEQLKAL